MRGVGLSPDRASLHADSHAPKNSRMRQHRPRLVVLTDITSNTAGLREPDDAQSMCRLMLYANVFRIEGLFATSNMTHGQLCRPELIHEIVDAYADSHASLATYDPAYPAPDALRATIAVGNPVAGPKVMPNACVGEAFDTDVSRRLIDIIDRDDPDPVWISVWGGTADLAQALWRASTSRSARDFDRFCDRVRVIACYDQDSTGEWIRRTFPHVWYWLRKHSIRGMYRNGDTSLASSEWVQTHIKPHGKLGHLYPDYRGGDIFWNTLGPVHGIKEGDTPTWLGLIPLEMHAPLIEHSDPTQGGWGGRGVATPDNPRHFVDTPEPDLAPRSTDISPLTASVYRWRPAFQADFADRLKRL